MAFDPSKLSARLDSIRVRRMRELLIALNVTQSEFMKAAGGAGHGREAISLALSADQKTRDALTEQARKYLNYCAACSVSPAIHIEIFDLAGKKFLDEVRQSQVKKSAAAAAFPGAAGALSTFEREYVPASLFFQELLEDVKNGEIGVEIVYLHPSALERHWKSWGKDLLVAVIGGLAGGLLGVLSAGGSGN